MARPSRTLAQSIGRSRRDLYRAASMLGDVQAVATGSPSKVAGRLVRKRVWRGVGRALGSLLMGSGR